MHCTLRSEITSQGVTAMPHSLIVALVGLPASGKSHLAAALVSQFSGDF